MENHTTKSEKDRNLSPLTRTAVVVTNYNYGFYLDRCLRSLAVQTDKNCHVVVVDDCSDDYSHSIMDQWEHFPNFTLIRNRTNIGLGPSCNVGIRATHSRYVVRVDADDFVCADYVYMLSRFLDHTPTVDAVVCDYYCVLGDYKRELMDAVKHPIACGMMFRREVLMEIGMYPEDRGIREDVDTAKRFEIGKFRLAHLAAPLYRYNIHKGSLTNGTGANVQPEPLAEP